MADEALKENIAAIEAANPPKQSATPAAKPEATDPPAAQVDDESPDEEDDTETPAASDGNDAPARPKNKGVGKRINELTKEKHDALREREYWRQEAERQAEQLRQLQQPNPPQAKPVAQADHQGRPTLEQFDFDQESHAEAVARWTFEQLSQQQESTRKTQERQRSFAEKETAFAAEHPDYEAVAKAPHVPITQAVAEEILQSDNPPAVAYYLGSHLDEAAAIAGMTPNGIARAIGRIEASLTAPAPRAEVPPTPPKTVTSAPAVPADVSARAPVTKPVASMSVEDHIERLRVKNHR